MMNKNESPNQEPSFALLNCNVQCLKGKITHDPNVRLALYRAVCNAALSEASVRSPLVLSPLWIDVLLNGVEDMWSSTRRECVECIRKLVYPPAASDSTLRHPPNSSHRSSPSAWSKHSANANTSEKGLLSVKLTGSVERACTAKWGETAAPHDDWRRQLPSKLLHRWARTRSGSSGWFQREGLLRVLKIYCDFNYAGYQESLEGQLWLREVLFRVGIPALHEAQLPVREEAASLLCIISQREDAFHSYILDRVVRKLRNLADVHETLAPPSKEGEAQIRAVEGHLIALIKLLEREPRSSRKESMYYLLMRYASHPASSVRQYVAEALCPPSEMLCIWLLRRLSMGSWWTLSHAQNHWQEGETVLMALQQHLLYYLAQGKGYNFNLERLISVATGEGPACFLRSCLESLLNASCASLFEISRMGRQIVPLLLQLWVRFASTPKVVLKVVQELAADSAHFSRSCSTSSENPSIAQRDRHRILGDLIAPLLWWYLAVRRATMATDDSENRTELEEADIGLFFRTLQGSTTKAKGSGFSTVVLIIGCYFLPLLSERDAAIVQEILLDTQTWENILQASPAVTYLHFGIDFVSSMKGRGRDLQHLIPVWLNALEGAQTHQQCILATMIREALCFPSTESQCESSKPGRPAFCRPFRFAYRDTFAAPAMLDGGEELPLGYIWLKAYYPTEKEVPPGDMFFSTTAGSHATSKNFEKQQSIIDALRHYICNGLYLSPVAEPEILREARALMVVMVSAYPRQDCYESVFKSLLVRLDRVCPQWERKVKITIDQKRKASDWDAWDDDSASSGPVEGISIEEEIQDASHTAVHVMQKMDTNAQKLISKKFGKRLMKLLH